MDTITKTETIDQDVQSYSNEKAVMKLEVVVIPVPDVDRAKEE